MDEPARDCRLKSREWASRAGCLKHPEVVMPSEQRFSVVRKMLEKAGWTMDRVNGSHHIFTKPNAATVSIPVHRGKVKPFYVRQVKQVTEGD